MIGSDGGEGVVIFDRLVRESLNNAITSETWRKLESEIGGRLENSVPAEGKDMQKPWGRSWRAMLEEQKEDQSDTVENDVL